MTNIPRSIAIRTSFFHHSDNAGYKQILKYTKPVKIFGIDERNKEASSPSRQKYLWLHEWDAYQYARKNPVDILHILYGEEYYRLSWRFFSKTPIIVSFHQPPDLLENEITKGNSMGRVMGLLHQLNRKRFEKLSAAIVMTEAQKQVLQKVIHPDKIHVLPLGVDIQTISSAYNNLSVLPQCYNIITVGNWRRDWNFYFNFAKYCETHYPHWKFILINRKFSEEEKQKIVNSHNIQYSASVNDAELYSAYKQSYLQFLPFEAAAGNNALNEGLALGCPTVTNFKTVPYQNEDKFIQVSDLSFEVVAAAFERFFKMEINQRIEIGELARKAVMEYDWSSIGNKTLEIYRNAMK